MSNVRRLSLLCLCVMAVPGLVAASGECGQDQQGDSAVSCSNSPTGDSNAASEPASAPQAYTWADLVELVPELREYDLNYPRRDDLTEAPEDNPNYLVCKKFGSPGTRILRRRCAPLFDFVAYKLAQRRRAEQARVGILLLPGPTPPVIQN